MQVIWGGRWQNGASATTEEEVEQINSHFSRLGTSTKHMLPEGILSYKCNYYHLICRFSCHSALSITILTP